MNVRVTFTIIGLAAALAACRGTYVPSGNSSGPALQGRDVAPLAGRTTAWGILVDDPSGKPLANIPVRLQPWDKGCVKLSPHVAKCPPNLPWRATTRGNGKFVLANVPNGDYLLIIGSNSPADLTRPTIHDHIKLTGGLQHLLAPTLPTIPIPNPDSTATPYPRPRAEKHGAWRLTTINPRREKPCAVAFDQQRAKHKLPPTVVDEWLMEQSREDFAYQVSTGTRVPEPVPAFSLASIGQAGAGTCSGMIATYFAPPNNVRWYLDPRALWFGGVFFNWNRGLQGGGFAQTPIDPRIYDPTTPFGIYSWPSE
jgi:hypothetical protein